MTDGLILSHPDRPAPVGFRESVDSGLILPVEVSRDIEKWTDDDRRTLDRAAKLLATKNKPHQPAAEHWPVYFQMFCSKPSCRDAPMQRIATPDGGFILRCAHKDRIFMLGSQKPAIRSFIKRGRR